MLGKGVAVMDKKILVVDDIKGWRDYHSYIMNELFEHANIQTAESARDGYDKLMENNDVPFDIILTDMQMETDYEPDYAGEWLIKEIKKAEESDLILPLSVKQSRLKELHRVS